MTKNLLRADESGAPIEMDDVGEMAFQIGKAFADLKWTHVHAKKRDHVHAKDDAHSAGEQISTAGRPTAVRDGAS